MTLRDAIKSKKNFRRKGEKLWLTTTSDSKITTVRAMYSFDLTLDDIMAEDWEVEREEEQLFVEVMDGDLLQLSLQGEYVYLFSGETGSNLEDKHISRVLDFFKDNTDIGRSRIR